MVRYLVYLLMAIFGVSIWILPRLFDNVDFLETLKPFISVSKWEGSAYSVVTRLLILSIFVYYGFHIYSDPNILKGSTLTIFRKL